MRKNLPILLAGVVILLLFILLQVVVIVREGEVEYEVDVFKVTRPAPTWTSATTVSARHSTPRAKTSSTRSATTVCSRFKPRRPEPSRSPAWSKTPTPAIA